MTDRIRIGVVGGGGIAKAHVIGARALRSYFGDDGLDAEVVAIADASQEAARSSAAAFGVDRWTTDWRELVADSGVDAITIATPNDTHAEIAVAAARAGKHVMSEKPLAHTVTAAREMLAAAEAAGIVHSVNLTYRNVAALRYARRLILSGELGTIVGFRSAFLQDWGADPSVPRSWKFEAARAGGGPMLSVGCHLVDLAHHLVGPITQVVASAKTWIPERPLATGRNTYAVASSTEATSTAPVDVEDLAAMLLRFDNGVVGTLEVSRISSGRKNYCFLEINGTEGSLVFDYERMNELQVAVGPDRGRGLTRMVIGPEQDDAAIWSLGGLGLGFADVTALQVRGFVRAIRDGTSADPSFRDGLRAQEVIAAASRSVRDGSWTTVEPVPAPVPPTTATESP